MEKRDVRHIIWWLLGVFCYISYFVGGSEKHHLWIGGLICVGVAAIIGEIQRD